MPHFQWFASGFVRRVLGYLPQFVNTQYFHSKECHNPWIMSIYKMAHCGYRASIQTTYAVTVYSGKCTTMTVYISVGVGCTAHKRLCLSTPSLEHLKLAALAFPNTEPNQTHHNSVNTPNFYGKKCHNP